MRSNAEEAPLAVPRSVQDGAVSRVPGFPLHQELQILASLQEEQCRSESRTQQPHGRGLWRYRRRTTHAIDTDDITKVIYPAGLSSIHGREWNALARAKSDRADDPQIAMTKTTVDVMALPVPTASKRVQFRLTCKIG